MKKLLILICLLSVTLLSAKVFDSDEPSARARAMAGAYASVSNDANGIFYNPAGLSLAGNSIYLSRTEIQTEFQVLYSSAMSYKLPKNYGTIAFGLNSNSTTYDDVDLQAQRTYALGYAFTLMKDIHSELNIGTNLNFYHLDFYDGEDSSGQAFGDAMTYGVNVGALAIVHQRTFLGVWAKNINNPKFGDNNDHELPRKLSAAISYLPYDGVLTTFELQKNLGYNNDTEIHAGTEIEVMKHFKLRVGVRNYPVQYSAGFGFDYKGVLVDYAFQTHTVLNNTHHFSIGYEL